MLTARFKVCHSNIEQHTFIRKLQNGPSYLVEAAECILHGSQQCSESTNPQDLTASARTCSRYVHRSWLNLGRWSSSSYFKSAYFLLTGKQPMWCLSLRKEIVPIQQISETHLLNFCHVLTNGVS